MTVLDALRQGEAALKHTPDPKLDAQLLLCHVLHVGRMGLLMSPAWKLTPMQEARYGELLHLRAGRQPLQYILGLQDFYGLELKVNESVLIPRQETETLCEKALRCLEAVREPAVADLCTGSGAIAIVLKKNRPGARVWATELSPGALALAKENAAASGAEITFLEGDLLEPLRSLRFDCIVSNPPYIASAELAALQPEVRREPRMALDGGPDGLLFYRRLAQDVPAYLNPDGKLYLEFGAGQAEPVSALFTGAGFTGVRIHRDLFGKERVLEAQFRFS